MDTLVVLCALGLVAALIALVTVFYHQALTKKKVRKREHANIRWREYEVRVVLYENWMMAHPGASTMDPDPQSLIIQALAPLAWYLLLKPDDLQAFGLYNDLQKELNPGSRVPSNYDPPLNKCDTK